MWQVSELGSSSAAGPPASGTFCQRTLLSYMKGELITLQQHGGAVDHDTRPELLSLTLCSPKLYECSTYSVLPLWWLLIKSNMGIIQISTVMWKYDLSVHDCCDSLCPSFVLLVLVGTEWGQSELGHERPALMVAELHVNDKSVRQFDQKLSISGTTIEALNNLWSLFFYLILFYSSL